MLTFAFVTSPVGAAGEIPESAWSRAQLVPPELADHYTLAFLFPQLSAQWGTSAFLVATGDESQFRGFGGSFGWNGSAVALMTQSGVPFSQVLGLRWPYEQVTDFPGSTRLTQLSWSRQAARRRFGAAFRGGKEDAPDNHIEHWELGVGAGAERGAASLDVALDGAYEKLESSRGVGNYLMDSGVRLGAALRISTPLVGNLSWTLGGGYHDTGTMTEVRPGNLWIGSLPLDATRRREESARRWTAGARFHYPAFGFEWSVFGQREDSDLPVEFTVDGYFTNTTNAVGVEHRRREVAHTSLGAAVQRPLRGAVRVHLGGAMRFQRTQSRVVEDWHTASRDWQLPPASQWHRQWSRETTEESEDADASVAGGLSGSWKHADVAVALTKADDLTLLLDVRVRVP